MVNIKIPFAKPVLNMNETYAVKQVLQSGWLCQGEKVQEFEEMFASYVGAKHAIAVSNCTTALHLALIVNFVGQDTEVLVPSFSFVASANAILHTQGDPVFVDIHPRTYNIDPNAIEDIINDQTFAIMAVHQYGLPCDIKQIEDIATLFEIPVIYDSACALGARYKGKLIGSEGINCFSFHPRKIITTGEGGMITTNDSRIDQRLRQLRSHGCVVADLEKHKKMGQVDEAYSLVGYNYRMTDIQAAIGIEQMKRLDWILQRRKEIALRYICELGNYAGIIVPWVDRGYEYNWQSFPIGFKAGHSFGRKLDRAYRKHAIQVALQRKRDIILEKMVNAGISCRRGIQPIHKEPYMHNLGYRVTLPHTEKASRTTMLLPIYPDMTTEEQGYVIDTLKGALK